MGQSIGLLPRCCSVRSSMVRVWRRKVAVAVVSLRCILVCTHKEQAINSTRTHEYPTGGVWGGQVFFARSARFTLFLFQVEGQGIYQGAVA
jgi:hypothetical protein